MTTNPTGWQPIDSAPKDGTEIFIVRRGWPWALVAHWGEYPGNPVLNDYEEDSCMWGWLFDNMLTPGLEDGFLGWNDDADDMPTHWSHLPRLETEE